MVPRTSSFDSIVKSRTRWLALSEAWHSPSKFELSKSNSQYYVHSTVIPWPSSFMPRWANLIPVTQYLALLLDVTWRISNEGFQMKVFKVKVPRYTLLVNSINQLYFSSMLGIQPSLFHIAVYDGRLIHDKSCYYAPNSIRSCLFNDIFQGTGRTLQRNPFSHRYGSYNNFSPELLVAISGLSWVKTYE
jgi:hypothetical protein